MITTEVTRKRNAMEPAMAMAKKAGERDDVPEFETGGVVVFILLG